MNILIAGVNGFIGTALLNYFKTYKCSHRIFGVDLKLRNRVVNSPYSLICDLANRHQLKKTLNQIKPDVVFYLAGGKPIDENALWQANFVSTKILLDTVFELKNPPCIIIPGSAAEYGKVKMPQKPVSEEFRPQPLSWYGFVKYAQTNLGLMYAYKGLDVRIARIFNITGYGTPASLAPGNFARKIVEIQRGKQQPILSVGRLSSQRDFIDIEDVCAALWAIAQKGKKGQIYNVCSGRPLCIRSLLHELIKYSDLRMKVAIKQDLRAHALTFNIIGSNTKIKHATGWCPRVSLEQSLKNTLRYYQQL